MHYSMTLSRHNILGGQSLSGADGLHVVYVLEGNMQVNGLAMGMGEAAFIDREEIVLNALRKTVILLFRIVPSEAMGTAHSPYTVLEQGTFDFTDDEAVVRLDQVTFPAKAVAWRHVHPGAGIRYLIEGELEISADDHSEMMYAGDAWYEGADSPVRATAGPKGISSFIRVMMLPKAYDGQPTIKLLNAEDMDKPRLQTNKRFFDKLVKLV